MFGQNKNGNTAPKIIMACLLRIAHMCDTSRQTTVRRNIYLDTKIPTNSDIQILFACAHEHV